jgi:hypothetical protein
MEGKRGRRGERGERGERGPRGIDGQNASLPVGFLESWALIQKDSQFLRNNALELLFMPFFRIRDICHIIVSFADTFRS